MAAAGVLIGVEGPADERTVCGAALPFVKPSGSRSSPTALAETLGEAESSAAGPAGDISASLPSLSGESTNTPADAARPASTAGRNTGATGQCDTGASAGETKTRFADPP